jgi:hypothetical protein
MVFHEGDGDDIQPALPALRLAIIARTAFRFGPVIPSAFFSGA